MRNASTWYSIITGDPPLLAFTVPGAPIAKERPRTFQSARGTRTITPERTRSAEEGLAWNIRMALRGRAPFEGNLAMVCVFYRPDRRRIDGDNMLKLVCDAGNLARLWLDDCQVTTKLARVELDAANPRTEIALGPFGSSLTR